jgi:hypothetical protein
VHVGTNGGWGQIRVLVLKGQAGTSWPAAVLLVRAYVLSLHPACTSAPETQIRWLR